MALPSMRASIRSNRSSGRGRLPTCVVRMRSVLRCIFLIPAAGAFRLWHCPTGRSNRAGRAPAACSPFGGASLCEDSASGILVAGRPLRHRQTKVMAMRKLLQGAALLAAILAACGAVAHAQADFPSRPIKMYVPFPPGGGIDVTARIAAEKLSEILGQQIAIINQGGGGGAIATDAVVRADPDGYTLLYHSVTGITHAAVTQDLSYDWLRGLAPVSLIARFAPVMIVSPSLPVKTMADFIALLKANHGKYSYGSSGTGTAVHLATELFKQKAGVNIVHIPYRGTVAVLPDLISGRVAMMIDGVPAEMKNIQTGVVRALAVTTETRSPALPDVPTMKEAGVDFVAPFWTGLYAPAATPQLIID